MRFPPRCEMRPDSPALNAEQFRAPYQTCKEPLFVDGTPESPQEYCHKSTRTLMSLQECEIVQCTPNQLEMKPDSPALAPEPSRVPHRTQVA